MTKIGRSECEDNAENSTCHTMPGYHTLEIQIRDALRETVKEKETRKLNVQVSTKRCLWDYPRHAQPC
jgi:hypothetical protein